MCKTNKSKLDVVHLPKGSLKKHHFFVQKFREGLGKVQEGFRGWKVQETFFDLFESFKSFD